MSAHPQMNLTPPDDLPAALASEDDLMPSVCARRLLMIVALLVVFGLTMLYSTSYNVVGTKHFKFQIIWAAMGTCAAFAVYFVGYRRLAAGRWFWIGLVAVMLLAARLFFPPINGAYRWIKVPIPGFPFSIQPSEFAKIAVALFAARYCADNLRTFNELLRWRGGILEFGAVVAPILGLILLGHDLGTTLLVALTAWAILTAAGLRWWYQVIPVIILTLGSIYIFFFDSMRLGRVLSFLDPERYSQDIGYQLWNSLLALGSGNWFGIGFMESRMKHLYLPESHTDFILAIVGEELGLIAM
ncbi:MAG: FtsW/RodA/SpoVE family cell cycle protein, partial [Lentisphaeria bacterium]|nr:FtsW/RodA/SpoVE family cell cycle protein [Lentisphaeria bacterium]